MALMIPMTVPHFVFVRNLPSVGDRLQPPDLEKLDAMMGNVMIATALLMAVLFAWLLSIGLVANKHIKKSIRPNHRRALWFAGFAMAYPIFVRFAWPMPSGGSEPQVPMGIIIPMHLLAMVAIFYVLGFAARNLIMAERQEPVTFFDYSGPFFLIWFFPIGVWFVQPRVNRLVSQ
ncbi:MAG: hypothetical protein ACR2QT_11495 [Woeseiaceae bacterium]